MALYHPAPLKCDTTGAVSYIDTAPDYMSFSETYVRSQMNGATLAL